VTKPAQPRCCQTNGREVGAKQARNKQATKASGAVAARERAPQVRCGRDYARHDEPRDGDGRSSRSGNAEKPAAGPGTHRTVPAGGSVRGLKRAPNSGSSCSVLQRRSPPGVLTRARMHCEWCTRVVHYVAWGTHRPVPRRGRRALALPARYSSAVQCGVRRAGPFTQTRECVLTRAHPGRCAASLRAGGGGCAPCRRSAPRQAAAANRGAPRALGAAGPGRAVAVRLGTAHVPRTLVTFDGSQCSERPSSRSRS
jgi:hypothetical protein